ncbi:hypothetical protein ECP03023084_0051 [Escherichia coli P0302308.4]|nr:hypothetical protein FORC41_3911 [Escherichia coli]EMX11190.1 hypothetical protein ECP03023081_0349 [Escherichia coli P0302308.1]END03961.1 hypothetical protein ECP030230810_0043 [Escherichia coli P0302308.10]END06328.1 hypothetical protein ECP030230811_0042 [Escherichia coli P0302308.11]END15818.1 hypothetical protein ECP03023083_0043 [Escherichia coli P0302308.3]END17930.1 hypothetical protein ECP03023082_0045 [Escherichia coli P0302308.2]END25074.1 hypothetical protein ECP03023085_0043 
MKFLTSSVMFLMTKPGFDYSKNTLLMLFSYDVMCNNPKYIARR